MAAKSLICKIVGWEIHVLSMLCFFNDGFVRITEKKIAKTNGTTVANQDVQTGVNWKWTCYLHINEHKCSKYCHTCIGQSRNKYKNQNQTEISQTKFSAFKQHQKGDIPIIFQHYLGKKGGQNKINSLGFTYIITQSQHTQANIVWHIFWKYVCFPALFCQNRWFKKKMKPICPVFSTYSIFFLCMVHGLLFRHINPVWEENACLIVLENKVWPAMVRATFCLLNYKHVNMYECVSINRVSCHTPLPWFWEICSHSNNNQGNSTFTGTKTNPNIKYKSQFTQNCVNYVFPILKKKQPNSCFFKCVSAIICTMHEFKCAFLRMLYFYIFCITGLMAETFPSGFLESHYATHLSEIIEKNMKNQRCTVKPHSVMDVGSHRYVTQYGGRAGITNNLDKLGPQEQLPAFAVALDSRCLWHGWGHCCRPQSKPIRKFHLILKFHCGP